MDYLAQTSYNARCSPRAFALFVLVLTLGSFVTFVLTNSS